VVVEVAFDVLQRSTRHQSGFALRFLASSVCGSTRASTRSTLSRRSSGCTANSRPGPSIWLPPRRAGPAAEEEPATGRGWASIRVAARTIVLFDAHGWTIQTAVPRRYPAAMFGSFNPVQELPLTLVTDRLVIQGTILTRVPRLTDLVNEPDATHLILQDTTFMEVGSRRVVANGVAAQVRLSDVLFVHANASTESTSLCECQRCRSKATLLLPPFTVEGTIYLPVRVRAADCFGRLLGSLRSVTGGQVLGLRCGRVTQLRGPARRQPCPAHVCIAAGGRMAW